MPAYTNDTRENGGRRQLISAVVLLVAAVSTAFLPAFSQQRVAAVIRSTVLRPFVAMQEAVAVARNRASDSGALRRELDSLVAVTTGHMTLADENRRLKSLLDLKQRVGDGWVPANVVRPGTSGSESMFLLDIGSEAGVEPYAPVIAGQGLVGVVREVYPNSAVAMDWTHPDFRVSAMDTLGTSYGIVRSRRGEFREEDRLEFDGAAFQALLEDGTTVVTSNLSGDWPRGVPIGRIEGLAEADAGWRKSYWLRPMVEVGSVTHVLVGVAPQGDLYGAWPLDSLVTDTELARQIQAREDSLQLLRTVLAAPKPLRDSLIAALLLGDPGAFPVGAAPADSVGTALPPAAQSPGPGGRGPSGAGSPERGRGDGTPAPGRGGGEQLPPSRLPGAAQPDGAVPLTPQTGGPPPDTTSRPPTGGAGNPAPTPNRVPLGVIGTPPDTTNRPPPGGAGAPAQPGGRGGVPAPRPDTLGGGAWELSAAPGTTVDANAARTVRIGEGGAPPR